MTVSLGASITCTEKAAKMPAKYICKTKCVFK